ncbi:MAG: signal recognition particle-docking protein FtsY [Synergistaceae bacterium]|nr:signal recognition particle-docking protein FtsY [Synergistaceae bacterium]
MGVFSKITGTLNKWSQELTNAFSSEPVDDLFWEELEDELLAGDVGLDTTEKLLDQLRTIMEQEGIATRKKLKSAFKNLLCKMLTAVPNMGHPLSETVKPSVYVFIGVNGSGKTTTCGKLAHQLTQKGKKVILAAADTFRAAAIEQLEQWGERAHVRVVAQEQGSDPAAVIFDAISSAKATNADVVIADTAGRLHNKSNLMEELGKVTRIIKREIPEGPAEVLIVLDAVTGQNGFIQAETFNKIMPITGVVLTKFDNTAKGGIVLAIADRLKLPIRYVGLGEGIDDLKVFNPEEFVDYLLDAEERERDEF